MGSQGGGKSQPWDGGSLATDAARCRHQTQARAHKQFRPQQAPSTHRSGHLGQFQPSCCNSRNSQYLLSARCKQLWFHLLLALAASSAVRGRGFSGWRPCGLRQRRGRGSGRRPACGTLTLVHSGGRGAVFDAVHPSFVNRPCRTTITVWSTRAGRFVSLFADRALHFVPADLIVRWLGDQPSVSETATVIPAHGATGLSMGHHRRARLLERNAFGDQLS
jgi:hypothetical protein